MPVRLVPCWRKLVACAPYGRALSSLLYKHEQNARASGGRKPKIACVASHLHTLITLLKKKNVRGDSPLRIYFYNTTSNRYNMNHCKSNSCKE